MSILNGSPFKTMSIEQLRVGQEAPPMIVEVTSSLIIGGALANRDPQEVHHDRDLVRKMGHKDIFLNNMTTMALVIRFLTDWLGPEAVTERFRFRLRRPMYPNDDLKLTGKIASIKPGDSGRGSIDVEITGRNSLGDHVLCDVRLSLPA
jgi:hypothetical protein